MLGSSRTLSDDERASARVIHAIMHPWPCRDIEGLRAAMRDSRERHGDDRHELVKWHAAHANAEQIAR
jgi:hypothetical protein